MYVAKALNLKNIPHLDIDLYTLKTIHLTSHLQLAQFVEFFHNGSVNLK